MPVEKVFDLLEPIVPMQYDVRMVIPCIFYPVIHEDILFEVDACNNCLE